MAYKTNSAPYLRTKKSTLQIMIELAIALGIVWLAAVITTFIKLGGKYGLRSILLMVVSVAVTAVCDVITTVLKNKKDKTLGKKIVYDLIHNYSWITAMIFTLLCPVWTDYYVVIVGSIFSTLIVKNLFGGFGSNIFNPAAFGRIFIQLCFGLGAPSDVTSGVISGATITGAYNSSQQWLGVQPIEGFSIGDILLGNYFGNMGEPFTILLLVLGIVLALRGVINWRAPVFYVGTVSLCSLILALVLGFDNPLTYLVYQIGLGGLMFGAVFMITDPVTTPTSPFGNCIVGIVAALLTVLIRIGTNSPEGVVYSIAIVNLISPSIDLFITGKTGEHTGIKSGVTFGLSALTLAVIITVGWFSNGGREVNSINGISRKEYDNLVAATNFKFMDEKKYSFAPYEKDLSQFADVLYEDESLNLKSAYSILDSNNEEVAVVYCVIGKDITIKYPGENEIEEIKRNGSAYVAISTKDNKVIGVSVCKAPCYQTPYVNFTKNYYTDFDYANKNILDVNFNVDEDGHEKTNATYSTKGIQDIVKAACDIYASQYNK